MSRSIDRIPDVITRRHPLVSNRDHPAKVKLFFDTPEVWSVGQTVVSVSWKEFVSDRNALIIHEQSHLYDWIWTVFFGNPFAEKVILLVCFEIVVRNVVIDQTGIPSIILFDPVIYPDLHIFFVLIQKRKTAVSIIQGVICFFKKTFSAIIRRSFRCRKKEPGIDQHLHDGVGIVLFFRMALSIGQKGMDTKFVIDLAQCKHSRNFSADHPRGIAGQSHKK